MGNSYAAWASRWRVPLGFALGAAYLVFAKPTLKLLASGGAVALAGLLLRAYAAGYLTKNQGLTTAGPYAYTRNPLYLGSLVMGLGFALAGSSWLLGAAFLVFFLAVYGPVIRSEAETLRRAFGESYEQYAKDVPLLVPRLRRCAAPSGSGQAQSNHPLAPSSINRGNRGDGLRADGRAGTTGEKFRWQQYRRNREYEAALGYLAALVFLALKAWLR